MNTQRLASTVRCTALSLAALAPVVATPTTATERQAAVATTTVQEVVGSAAAPDGWRVASSLSLAARSDYLDYGDRSSSFAAFAASAQFRFTSPARPFSGGVLFEYAAIQGRADSALVAAVVTYGTGPWTFSFAPFIKRTIGAPAQWREQTTVRYRSSPRSSLGVELIGPLRGLESSRFLLGYYGTYSKSLSFAVTAGRAIGSGPDRVYRTAITWRLR